MSKLFITGANRGIGLALVRAFLVHGDFVYAGHRSVHPNDPLMELQDSYPQQIELIQVDVTNQGDREAAYEKVAATTDSLEILINNAGILRPAKSFTDINEKDLRDSFEVNTITPLLLAKTFLPLLERGANPKIINITMPTTPIASLESKENHHYIASRFALNSLTKMLSLELIERGIITVALYPGYIKTDMTDHAEAATSQEEAIPPLIPLIHGLTEAHNGKCILPDGSEYTW